MKRLELADWELVSDRVSHLWMLSQAAREQPCWKLGGREIATLKRLFRGCYFGGGGQNSNNETKSQGRIFLDKEPVSARWGPICCWKRHIRDQHHYCINYVRTKGTWIQWNIQDLCIFVLSFQVSLSRMILDIFKFCCLYLLVLFAFSCGNWSFHHCY